jgi:hypothetical protein
VLRVRVPLWLLNMAYGVVRQGFDPVLQGFLCQQWGVAPQARSCCKRLSQRRATCASGIVIFIYLFHLVGIVTSLRVKVGLVLLETPGLITFCLRFIVCVCDNLKNRMLCGREK